MSVLRRLQLRLPAGQGSIIRTLSTKDEPFNFARDNVDQMLAAEFEESIPETPSVDVEDIVEARKRIKDKILLTPLNYSSRLSDSLGTKLYLKMENYQMAGSYKERGASNKISQLSEEQRKNGVICCSAGNHAQAVAHWATQLGVKSTVVMPTTAPLVKVSATKRFGANVVLHGDGFDDAYQEARRICDEEDMTFVHAFNDKDVVAGQGTVGLELLEQNPYLDAVIVPVGGGGLIAGMSVAMRELNPRIKIYGVEAKKMPGMLMSLEKQQVTYVPFQKTLADGIAISNVGSIPFNMIQKFVDKIVTVDEDDIAQAVMSLLEVEKTVVEGSGACGLAALQKGLFPELEGKRVATICTGGNIDLTVLGRIIDRGMVKDGRMAQIVVTVADSPGSLANILLEVAKNSANVRNVLHDRAYQQEMSIGLTQIILELDTKGHDHVEELVKVLEPLTTSVRVLK